MDLIKEIKDVSGLEAWLLTQPKDVAVQIAHRAAMRVLPIHWQYSAKQSDSKSLPILRASLIASVADQIPEQVIKAASDGMALADTVAIHGADHAAAAATAAANQRNDFVAYAAAAAYEATYALGKVAQVSAASVGDADADKLGVIAGAHAWQMVRVDAEFLVANHKLRFAPLWANRQNPVQVVWEMVEALLEKEKSDWSFWLNWYQAALDGKPLDPELIKEIATQEEAFWEGTDSEVNARIAEIWQQYQKGSGAGKTALAEAAIFDFIELNNRLKMVGFPRDISPFEDETKKRDFLADLEELRTELVDWLDFVGDAQQGNNRSGPLARAVRKLMELFYALDRGEAIPLRRFATIGSDLRLLSMDQSCRSEVGDTLAEMLDSRIEWFSEISRAHLGTVFLALDPLKELELGDLDSAELVQQLDVALKAMDDVDESDLPRLTPESRATLEEMLDELRAWSAEIKDADGQNRLPVLQKRFAERYGGVVATVGRYVEKGNEVAQSGAKRFDEVVKWFRRMQSIDKMIEFVERLIGAGGSGTPPMP